VPEDRSTVQVVEPVSGADVSEKEEDFIWCPADDESTAYDHWRHGSVATRFACGVTL